MKKKVIIILSVVIVSIMVLCLFLFNNREQSLECRIEENDGAKKALIVYTYSINDDNVLKINAVTELNFLNKEEADKYEKIVNIAFVKDEVTRKDNKIIIVSEAIDDENSLTLKEIKTQQEDKGFVCN